MVLPLLAVAGATAAGIIFAIGDGFLIGAGAAAGYKIARGANKRISEFTDGVTQRINEP